SPRSPRPWAAGGRTRPGARSVGTDAGGRRGPWSLGRGADPRIQLAPERLRGSAELVHLGPQRPELVAVPGGRPFDPPVQALQDQLGPVQDLPHRPLVEAVMAGRDAVLDVLVAQRGGPLVQLVPERL